MRKGGGEVQLRQFSGEKDRELCVEKAGGRTAWEEKRTDLYLRKKKRIYSERF